MKIAPSVLTADFTNLKEELSSIDNADLIHLDIMDGHFVPNISFGPFISKQIEKNTHLPLDVHLMVTDPLKWIDDFSFDQTKYITIHAEANHVSEAISLIRKNNIHVGLSIKPKTHIRALIPYLNEVNLILIMTVEPGFGGQTFMYEMLDKVKELVKIRKENKLNFLIEVDGGINSETILNCKDALVDICVVGSYIFNSNNRKKVIDDLR
jgi:ribulose-phosphate 3-epimerase